jgi:1-acyl-sn-glycerol-3-phosphate acyltransferase
MDSWQYRPAADQGLKPHDRLRSLKREAGMLDHALQSGWRLATRAYLRIYHRLTVAGLEHVPSSAPFVIVANHASHLDALTLAAALPWALRRAVFPIAAGDVFFETPVVSFFSAMMLNALPMWRHRCGSHALAELRERLIGEPAIYILFPEGTRSRDGQLGRFKPGIGMMVAGSAVPVVPCYLSGAHLAFPADARVPRPKKLQLRIGQPLVFEQVKDDRDGWLEVARQLEAAVGALRDPAPKT